MRGHVYWHPTTSQLYEHALARGDARLAEGGPLVVDTGKHTGRSPKDKFVVREPGSEDADLVGGRQRGDLGGALRPAPRQGRGAPERGGRLRRRRVRRRGSGASPRRPRDHREPVARALREDALHRSDGRGARRDGAAGARPARAVGLGRPRGGRHANRDLRLPPPVADRGRHRRHVLRGRDQEVDLHGHERPAAARGRVPDALLGEPRRRRVAWRCSSVSPARARRRSRPIPSVTSSATTSTAGRTTASSTSRAAATRR